MEVILENLRNLRQKCGEEGTIKFKDVEFCCTVRDGPVDSSWFCPVDSSWFCILTRDLNRSYLASILINADWSTSPETRILKCFLDYPIGQLSDFLLPLDPRQVPSQIRGFH